MKLKYMILLFSVVFFLAGCQNSLHQAKFIDFREKENPFVYGAGDSTVKPIRIALASVWSPKETIQSYRKIAEYVSRELGVPFVLIQRTSYEEENLLLANGDADIAFSSTGAYSAYRGLTEIEVLAMQEYQGNSFYRSYVIVHKNSNIEGMGDLKNKVFAFTDRLSYSGHLAVVDFLLAHEELPQRYFKRAIYTYNHDKSLWAVANNLVDGASIDSMNYEYAAQRTPEITDKIRIVATIGPAPTGPIVMRKDLSPELKAKLKNIFLKMDQDPETHQAMQEILIDRFVLPQPELYEPLRRLFDKMSGSP